MRELMEASTSTRETEVRDEERDDETVARAEAAAGGRERNRAVFAKRKTRWRRACER